MTDITHPAAIEADLTPAEKRVEAVLAEKNLPIRIIVLRELATTAQMAADVLGVEVGRIVKSLCFRGADSGTAYMLLVSGANRVHEKRVGRQLGEKLERPDAEFVKQATGFSIGGVSPFGHPAPMTIVMDTDFNRYETVWAAAGNPRSVFEITPADLASATGANIIDVT